jgi:hypothetical protein
VIFLPSASLRGKTLAARGLEEHIYASFPDFCDNRPFYVIFCVSRLCTFFKEFLIYDS